MHLGLRPSLTTINRAITNRKLSLKKLAKVPIARNTPRTIRLRFDFVVILVALSGKKIFSIDEMGCNLHTRRNYGRSPVGQPAVISTPTQRGNNLSICAAIGVDGVRHYRTKIGAYNTGEFLIFLNELYPKIEEPTNAAFLMDNVKFHHSHVIKQWFEEKKIVQVFVPPYSPMLNPIEECFSKVHREICMARVSTANTLVAAVASAFSSVTAKNCRGWFEHTIAYNTQCLRKQPILVKADPRCPKFRVEDVADELDEDISEFDIDQGETSDGQSNYSLDEIVVL